VSQAEDFPENLGGLNKFFREWKKMGEKEEGEGEGGEGGVRGEGRTLLSIPLSAFLLFHLFPFLLPWIFPRTYTHISHRMFLDEVCSQGREPAPLLLLLSCVSPLSVVFLTLSLCCLCLLLPCFFIILF